MNSPLKIASRSSPLALVQVQEIIRELKEQRVVFDYELVKFLTAGDKDKTTALTQSADNFFTDTIDQSLLDGHADIAVHSAKDLPQALHDGLKVLALTKGLSDKDAWVSRYHWKDLPLNAKVGTSSVLRQQQILSLRPDLQIINIRGTIQERLQMVKDSRLDGVVVALCALQRLKLDSEVKDVFPWEGMPLQGQLAVVGRQNNYELDRLFSAIDIRRLFGMVTLVGAGPGDRELITLKGIKALEAADCVFYDYLVDASLLQYASKAEHIYVGKRKGEHSLLQSDLSQMLKQKALAGKNVVRLKGGDPLIFGRGADEIQYLRSYHVEVAIIPGISSATGIPSSLGIPLTARGLASSVAFLSGHAEDESKDNPQQVDIPQADTLVFLMGLTKLNMIVKSLQESGYSQETPIMIVSNGTKPQELILKGTLLTIEELVRKQDLKPPALIMVGKTIDLYKPDSHKTFLHCGTHPEMYGYLGKILSWPMIDIKPVDMNEAQEKFLLQTFESADLIICTSCYAVESLFHVLARIEGKKIVREQVKDKLFAVIGRQTQKALNVHHIQARIVSEEETAQGLFKAITQQMKVEGKHIFFPRSNLPNPFLKEALIKQGALVSEITIYENTKPPTRDIPAVNIDGIIFTSPSTVRNFLADYGTIPASWVIIAKGPVTLKTLQEAGYLYATSLS